MISLYPHQEAVIDLLSSGKVLVGEVGTGKSRTALAFFYKHIAGGSINPRGNPTTPVDLYIITPAKKRDSLDWVYEASSFGISDKPGGDPNIKLTVDSWNNIQKYIDIQNAFFIFDEQRLVGRGSWVKSFLKIAKQNRWILLTATPADTWMDYIPLFVANGFYRNRTEFVQQHVIYASWSAYPAISGFVREEELDQLVKRIVVYMDYEKRTVVKNVIVECQYNKTAYDIIKKTRWNTDANKPIKTSAEYCYLLRKIVNSDKDRLQAVVNIQKMDKKIIVFYNYDYELALLRNIPVTCPIAEYNGHIHQDIPQGDEWIYLVQYVAGSEAWNCISTDTIVFYSLHYSHRKIAQSIGRIDRLNTPYDVLYAYWLTSASAIDHEILSAISRKKTFNEKAFAKTW